MNSIAIRQNEPRMLQLLAAQRRTYSDAKILLAVAMMLVGPCAVAFAVAAAELPAVKATTIAWVLAIMLLNLLWLEPRQKELVKLGAAIQETFDCAVLELGWNELKGHPHAPPEVIDAAASRYSRESSNPLDLRDWYPTAASLVPLPIGRLICQRTNCAWEDRTRLRYAWGIIGMLCFMIVAFVSVALIAGLRLDEFFLLVVAPLLPAVVLALRQGLEHRDAARTSARLAKHAEDLITACAGGTWNEADLTIESRRLQDEIVDRRRRAPLVFDFIYQRMRSKRDDEMRRAAEALVDRALDANGARTPWRERT